MNRIFSTVLSVSALAICVPGAAQDDAVNLAVSASATASSQLRSGNAGDKAIDGMVADDSRWVSVDGSDHWLELEFAASFTFGSAHVYTGWQNNSAVKDFELQAWDGGRWRTIPGAKITNNRMTERVVVFKQSVETTRIRLVSPDQGKVRVKELMLWAPQKEGGSPELGAGVKLPKGVFEPDPRKHYVILNQVGFDTDAAKRFTAPHSPNGSSFVVTAADDTAPLFKGTVRDHVGDFSEFRPEDSEREYVVRLEGGGLEAAVSDPFLIRPMMMLRLSLTPALQFMIDSRSMTGTHPSAYGGTPWRDGVYYTYEMPSLVLMYLANPAYFEALPVEMDYEADKARIMAPDFRWVRATKDEGYLEATRDYFTRIDPPVGQDIPDIVQLIHWGVGMYLADPISEDPSGGNAGLRIHDQTVEQFAYFLYAYPHMAQYFTRGFYDQTLAFALEQWQAVGLFDVITQYEGPKGRKAPGHSIMPNLMMHEVATREGLVESDRFLDAAVAQASWVVATLDPRDPEISKGQRMSEHKLITGLVMLQQTHPDRAPKKLTRWLEQWSRVAVQRSDNMYDLRKYDDVQWTLPKPWNEPGNIAGFPGLAIAVSDVIEDEEIEERLAVLVESHYDNLFGRNPLMAASSERGAVDYPGIERGFPKKYHEDWCARLELCRGTLNSNAADEHFPFNPTAGFRHCEGWTAFNAAFNVSLAYSSWEQTAWGVAEPGDKIDPAEPLGVSLTVRAGTDPAQTETVVAQVSVDGEQAGEVTLTEEGTDGIEFAGSVRLQDYTEQGGETVTLSYGHKPFDRSLTFKLQEDGSYRIVND